MNAYIKYLWLKNFVYFASTSFSRGSKGIENSSKLSKPKARKIYYKKRTDLIIYIYNWKKYQIRA